MSVFEIPLSARPEKFDIEIAGQQFVMRTHFNVPMDRWTIDIGKSESEWIIRNLALVAGQNLLEQYEHLNLGFGLHIFVDGEPTGEATFDNLGSDAHLLVTIP